MSWNLEPYCNIKPRCLTQDPAEYVTLPLEAFSKDITMQITFEGKTADCNQTFNETTAYSLIVYTEAVGLHCKLVSNVPTTKSIKSILNVLCSIFWVICNKPYTYDLVSLNCVATKDRKYFKQPNVLYTTVHYVAVFRWKTISAKMVMGIHF